MTTHLPLLLSNALRRAGFSHGFSTRLGGVSPAPFDSLDFATLRDPATLAENQARLGRALGFDPTTELFQVTQVHGSDLVVAREDPKATLARTADALVAEPGSHHAVAVRVADCVPLLLADPTTGRVAAVHAGWRGVEGGVIGVAVRQLASSAADHLLAAIGPCIGPCCFEVSRDVGEQIARVSTPDVIVRRDDANGKAYVDLRLAARVQLVRAGLRDDNIEDVPARDRTACTRCDRERFYSFRRDGDASGRLVGVIVAR